MAGQVLRDIVSYLGVLAATMVVASVLPWIAAALCVRAGRGKACAALSTLIAAAVVITPWAAVMQSIAPLHYFLGLYGWIAFITLPVVLIVCASLFMLWRGPALPWSRRDYTRATLGAIVCGLLGFGVVWQNQDHTWGWSISMSGCGVARGTADWLTHREDYRLLWWGDSQAWYTRDCAKALNARTAGQAGEDSPSPGP